jgi:rhodanese-related sulfurtransferase
MFGRKNDIKYISAQELKDALHKKEDIKIIDVCEPVEHAERKIDKSENIPLGVLQIKLMTNEFSYPPQKKIVVYCAHGNRSRFAASILIAKGYKEVYSLTGGIADYTRGER